jgi:hypothetical protein
LSKFRTAASAIPRLRSSYATKDGCDPRRLALHAARKAHGLSPGEAARVLGIPAPSLIKVETGTMTFVRERAWEDAAHYYKTHRDTEAMRANLK